MGQLSMTERIENIEKIVEPLVALPARMDRLESRVGAVEAQIVQLRSEMKDEFSAIRRDFGDLRGEFTGLGGEFTGLRGEIADLRLGFEATRFEVTALAGKVDQLGTDMRSLHEEVLDRIKLLGEGFSSAS